MVDPTKVSTIIDWPRLTSVKEVKSFLGRTSYYRKFVKEFSIIAKPMTKLTQKDVKFQWSDECENSFCTLKNSLVTAHVLTLPEPGKRFVCSDTTCNTPVAHGPHGRYSRQLSVFPMHFVLTRAHPGRTSPSALIPIVTPSQVLPCLL